MAEYPLDLGILQESLPSRPGVYLFKDEKDQVLYVGKAKDLKKRVLSYLFRQPELSERIGLMLKATKGLDILVTNTESEAFILERNLIKRWMPKFNVVLRDDKQYPLLRIPVNEPFPNISVVRRIKKDGAKYFGPYTSSNAMRETLRVLYKAFSLRKCKGAIKFRSRPCLNYQMKRCLGPCTGEVREEDYRRQLDQAIQFLEGKARSLIDSLKKEMFELSEAMEFERAALLRDRIKAIQRTLEPQAIVSSELEDSDILGIAEGSRYMHVVVLRLRDGIMQEGVPYRLMGTGETQEVVASFIKQFYPDLLPLLPPLIITPVALKDSYEIGAWLEELSGRPIRIRSPKSASERMLVKMASQNALRLVNEEKEREEDLLLKLKEEVRLKRYPRRIECVDISNFGGDYAVGSIVCYLDGRPYKKGYRSFLIRTVKGVDDYAMIKEVISRRIKYPDLPDLLVIDGGKGHLNAAKSVLQDQIPLENPPEVIAIAKDRHESAQRDKGDGDRVFIFNRKDPIRLEKQVLYLLMSIRDEAHRRAISHHKKRMSKGLKVSFLDQIKGIGPKKKRMLLKEFGSLKEILGAEAEELTKIPGISPEIAEEILRKGKELLERDREA